MPRHTRLLGIIVAAICTATGGDARAYNEPGHLETIRLVVERLPSKLYTTEDKRVIVACSQLPDMVEELDAARLYFNAFRDSSFQWLRWAVSDTLGTDALKRMFAVQQLLHGLTNGDSASMHRVALTVVGRLAAPRGTESPGYSVERFQRLCASGLSLHLLGDSLAHTQLAWDKEVPGQSMKMYPTGRGHGLSDQHLPDYIFCSYLAKDGWNGQTSCHEDWTGAAVHQRYKRWRDFWSSENALMAGRALSPDSFSAAEIAELEQGLRSLKTGTVAGLDNGSYARNDFGAGDAIVAFLSAHSPRDAALDEIARTARNADDAVTDSRPHCDVLLLKIAALSGAPAGGAAPKPTCSAVWQRYSAEAIGSFVAEVCPTSPGKVDAPLPFDVAWKRYYSPCAGNGQRDIERFAKLVLPAP